MVASCRKGQKGQNINIKAKQKSLMPNSPKSHIKNFKAKSNQKRPNLAYLALHKAKWQTFLARVADTAHLLPILNSTLLSEKFQFSNNL